MNYVKNSTYYPIVESHVLAANLSVFQEVYPINVFTFKQDKFKGTAPLLEAAFYGELERQIMPQENEIEVALVNSYRRNLLAITCKTLIKPISDLAMLENYLKITSANADDFNIYQELARQKEDPGYELKLENLIAKNEQFKMGLIILVDLAGFEQYADFLKSSILYQTESLMKYLRFMLYRSRPHNLRQIIECQIETIAAVFSYTANQNEHKLAYFELLFPNQIIHVTQFESRFDWSLPVASTSTIDFVLNNSNQRIVFEPKHAASYTNLPVLDKQRNCKMQAERVYYMDKQHKFSLELPLFIRNNSSTAQQLQTLETLARDTLLVYRYANGYKIGAFPFSFVSNALRNFQKPNLLNMLYLLQYHIKVFLIGPEAIVNLLLRSLAPLLSPVHRDRIIFAFQGHSVSACETSIHPLSHYLNPERCASCGKFKHIVTYIHGDVVGVNGYSAAGLIVQACVLKLEELAIINLCEKSGIVRVFKGREWEEGSLYLRALIGGQFYNTAEEVLEQLIAPKSGSSADELRKVFDFRFRVGF